MIISRTPFRISFFGGGTDYPDWYLKHGGMVLSTTINKYIYITCRWLPPFFPHKYRVSYSKIEDVAAPADIVHPAVRAVFKEYETDRGIELHSDADLPARAGLGSSSSFMVGLLNSMEALHCRHASPGWLAREGIRYEQNVLKEHVGSQDQTAAAYGGLNAIHFRRDGEIDVRPVILGKERKQELGRHLMLFFSGFSRSASDVASSQLKNMPNCERDLTRMGKMADDAIDILASGGDIRQFGELLHDAWTCKRRLSDKISTENIDLLYSRARQAGAIGGKLLGAGGGGFFLLFVAPENQRKVKDALADLLNVPFEMETSGSQIIYFTE